MISRGVEISIAGGVVAMVRGGPRRRSPSHPLYILRTASGRLDGHNSYSIVGVFLWISLSRKHTTTQPYSAVTPFQRWGRRGVLGISPEGYRMF